MRVGEPAESPNRTVRSYLSYVFAGLSGVVGVVGATGPPGLVVPPELGGADPVEPGSLPVSGSSCERTLALGSSVGADFGGSGMPNGFFALPSTLRRLTASIDAWV